MAPANEGSFEEQEQQQQQYGERVSQRSLPMLPGYYKKRADALPCGELHVKMLRCYQAASPLTYGPCREEHDAFWACMRHHQPAHKKPGDGQGAALRSLREDAWPWVKEQARAVQDWFRSSSGGGSGSGSNNSSSSSSSSTGEGTKGSTS